MLLGKVLADQAIRVFVSNWLMGGIGVDKIYLCAKGDWNAFMIGELLAVICCDRVRSHRKRLQGLEDSGSHRLRCLAVDLCQDG